MGLVVGLVLGVVHRVLPAPEQTACASMDLNGDPVAVRVLPDDEPVGIRDRDVGSNGRESNGGRHRVFEVHPVLWEPFS